MVGDVQKFERIKLDLDANRILPELGVNLVIQPFNLVGISRHQGFFLRQKSEA
jgi:hypothetical protein